MNADFVSAVPSGASKTALPVQDDHMEPLIVSALIEQGFASAPKCVLAGKVVANMVQRRVGALKSARIAELEAEINRRKGDPSTRLHNLCEGIARDADGSEWSREEWERLDAENAKLRALAASHAQLLASLVAILSMDLDPSIEFESSCTPYNDKAARVEFLEKAVESAHAAIAAAEGLTP